MNANLKSFHIPLLLLVSLVFSLICSPKTKQEQINTTVASTQAQIITDYQLQLQITIPPHFHAYLDKGKKGNLIPIDFDWTVLLKNGSLTTKPKLVITPSGENDANVGAKVLRGQGTFVFENENFSRLAGQELKVRLQICDEIQGICYRPKWVATPIRKR